MRKQLAVIVFAVLVAITPMSPAIVDRIYSASIYAALQRVMSSMSNLVPVALLDVLISCVVGAWIVLAIRDGRRHGGLFRTAIRVGARTVVWGAFFYLVFVVTWGLNYRRLRLAEKIPFDASAVTGDAARAAGLATVAQLNALHDRAHAEGWTASASSRIDPILAGAFDRAMSDLGLPRSVVVGRPKRTLLDGYFRRAGVDGMVDPFFLETLIAGGVLPFERPFVTAHEWSHLAGIADEGDANFAGWMAVMRGSPAHQYSGWLFLYSELARAVGSRDRAALSAGLAPGPRADLQAIRDRFMRDVNPTVSGAGWRVYDSYLKANRVEAGAASYAEVVRLVLGSRLPDNPLAR